MKQHTELDEDLGIVDELNEKNDSIDKEKIKILVVGAVLLGIVGYMLYSTLKPKPKPKVEKQHKTVHIKKKQFDPIPVEKPEQPKPVEKELPMTPFEKPKEKETPKVVKYGRNSVIKFNSGAKMQTPKEVNPNEFDVNIYNRTKSLAGNTPAAPLGNGKKAPTMYRGGDYAIAGISRQDPNLSLAKGSYIECTMVTRIVSSYSGNVKCLTSEDIYSTNGRTLLIEKGSTVTGHFKGANIEYGVDRLFVIWDEIRTPNNIVINLDSQATGTLGATGVDGYVDNHWGMRFGSAVLISILDIGAEALRDKYTRGDNTNINYNGNTPVENMANTALKEFINIKPTFYKNHGDVVGIYVEKDLDFSKVYRLK